MKNVSMRNFMMQVLLAFVLLDPNKGKDDLANLLPPKLFLPPPLWQLVLMSNKAMMTNTIRYLVFIYF
jgi:hypothetical protein